VPLPRENKREAIVEEPRGWTFRKSGGELPLRAADASEEGVCNRATPRVGHRAELHAEAKRSTCEPDVPRDDATCRRCRGQMKPSN
jgi:hypothetical protein